MSPNSNRIKLHEQRRRRGARQQGALEREKPSGQAKQDAVNAEKEARRATDLGKQEQRRLASRRYREGLDNRPRRRPRAAWVRSPPSPRANRAAAQKLRNADEIDLEEKHEEILPSIEVEVKMEVKEEYGEDEIQRIIDREPQSGELKVKKEEEEDDGTLRV